MLYVNPLGNELDPALGAPARRAMAFREFEQVLAYQIIKEMRASVPDDELLGNSAMRGPFEDFLNDALAKEWARTGELGLAKQLEAQHAAVGGESSPHPAAARL